MIRRVFPDPWVYLSQMKTDTRKMTTTFSVTQKDARLVELLAKTDHKTLAQWAMLCTERFLQYFERQNPKDLRPRHAIESLQAWIDTGEFRMATIRKAALESHAAARDVGEDTSARSAARAAGQAVATAHVPTHSIGAANYAVQAIYRSADSANADALIAQERDWQYRRLLELREASHHALENAPQLLSVSEVTSMPRTSV